MHKQFPGFQENDLLNRVQNGMVRHEERSVWRKAPQLSLRVLYYKIMCLLNL